MTSQGLTKLDFDVSGSKNPKKIIFPLVNIRDGGSGGRSPPGLCINPCILWMHIMHACILCMHIMHAYYACIFCMHACMHNMHTRYSTRDVALLFFWRAPTCMCVCTSLISHLVVGGVSSMQCNVRQCHAIRCDALLWPAMPCDAMQGKANMMQCDSDLRPLCKFSPPT